jgi:hypothetical protein
MKNKIESNFVSPALIKDLESLGFRDLCLGYWIRKECAEEWEFDIRIKDSIVDYMEAPTWEQAFELLREKYNLEYLIIKSANGNYFAAIHKNTREYLDTISTLGGHHHACVEEIVDMYSYEEARKSCVERMIQIAKK